MKTSKLKEMFLERTNMVMSIPQYNAYMRGELTLQEIREQNRAASIFNRLLNNPLVFKTSALILALLLNIDKKCYALTNGTGIYPRLEALVEKTMEIVYIVQTVGFVICLIMGLIDIIKAMINKNTDEIISIAIKYLLGFVSLFAFPFFLKLILDTLGGGGVLWD